MTHSFPTRRSADLLEGRVPAMGGPRLPGLAGLRGRRPWPAGRRSRPGRALGDGPGAVAARRPRRVAGRAGAGGRAQPELRARPLRAVLRSEEHTSELQSLMRISYAVFCLKKKKNKKSDTTSTAEQTNI